MYKSERMIIEKEGRMFSVEKWDEEINTYVNVIELMCEEYRNAYAHDEIGTESSKIAEIAITELIRRHPNL